MVHRRPERPPDQAERLAFAPASPDLILVNRRKPVVTHLCLHDHMIISGWCVDHLRVPTSLRQTTPRSGRSRHPLCLRAGVGATRRRHTVTSPEREAVRRRHARVRQCGEQNWLSLRFLIPNGVAPAYYVPRHSGHWNWGQERPRPSSRAPVASPAASSCARRALIWRHADVRQVASQYRRDFLDSAGSGAPYREHLRVLFLLTPPMLLPPTGDPGRHARPGLRPQERDEAPKPPCPSLIERATVPGVPIGSPQGPRGGPRDPLFRHVSPSELRPERAAAPGASRRTAGSLLALGQGAARLLGAEARRFTCVTSGRDLEAGGSDAAPARGRT